MQQWVDRFKDALGQRAGGPPRATARAPYMPAPSTWSPPRRPGRTRRRSGGPGATVSALVFLFVTASLCAGLYYGLRWANRTEGGIISGTVGGVLGRPDAEGTPGASSGGSAGAIRFATPTLEGQQPGQTPGAESAAPPAESDQPAPEAAETQQPEATPTPSRRTHVVQAGDNPARIALRYGVDAGELMRVNNITDPRRLRVGQELIIPEPGTPDSSTPAAETPAAGTPSPAGTGTVAPRN
jgi:LysM repeat protein